MSSTRDRYTEAEKARAVGMAAVMGQTQAAEALGIPKSTLHGWWERPDLARLRTTAREDVAEQMWEAAQLGLAEMVKGLENPRAPLRDKTMATSMLVEKYLLLTGQATSRTEQHVALTQGLDDHEREALRRAIDEWLAAQEGVPS